GEQNGVHMECVYAMDADKITISNSTFTNCSIMDLYFTSCTWCNPKPAPYGGVTLVNNVFNHSTCDGCGGVPSGWHYYGLVVGPGSGGDVHGWTVENNMVEQDVDVAAPIGANNTFCGNAEKGQLASGSLWPKGWERACS